VVDSVEEELCYTKSITTPQLTLVYAHEVIARNQAGLDAEYGSESKALLSLLCLALCPCWPS